MAGIKESFTKGIATINMKTSNFMEESKYKTHISNLENEINNLELTLGRSIYERWRSGGAYRDGIEETLLIIQSKYDEIEEEKQNIAKLREAEKQILGTGQQAAPAQPQYNQQGQYGASVIPPSGQYGASVIPPSGQYGTSVIPPSGQYGASVIPPSGQYGTSVIPPSGQYAAPVAPMPMQNEAGAPIAQAPAQNEAGAPVAQAPAQNEAGAPATPVQTENHATMAINFCRQCGAQNDVNYKFCCKCGAVLQ